MRRTALRSIAAANTLLVLTAGLVSVILGTASGAQQIGPLASGGLLVAITCSLEREENEDVVARFLATHPEFAPLPLDGLLERHLATDSEGSGDALLVAPIVRELARSMTAVAFASAGYPTT